MLLRFYPGLTRSEIRAIPAEELSVLIDVMNKAVSDG